MAILKFFSVPFQRGKNILAELTRISEILLCTEASAWICSLKKVLLQVSQIERKTQCVGVILFEKRDSGTGLFLKILRKF